MTWRCSGQYSDGPVLNSLHKILHLTPRVGRGSTGLGSLTLDLARSQVVLGCDAEIWCTDDRENLEWASRSSGLENGRIRGFRPLAFGPAGFSVAMEQSAAIEGCASMVVHQHG